MDRSTPQPFWVRPPVWVWLLLLGSLTLLSLSMWTLYEGLRFASRPLEPAELEIVRRALDLRSRVEGPRTPALIALRNELRRGHLRVMDEPSFRRPSERATRGYTDEHGRILLNPRICFANLRLTGRLELPDVVRTMSTLEHEYAHWLDMASESEACARESKLLRHCLSSLSVTTAERRELEEWAHSLDATAFRGPVPLQAPPRFR